jgi:hypothetical protein
MGKEGLGERGTGPCLRLRVTDIEFRIDPLRIWLITFKKAGTDEVFYSAVLPDGTIVGPEDEMKV